jgi:hypothetical protein
LHTVFGELGGTVIAPAPDFRVLAASGKHGKLRLFDEATKLPMVQFDLGEHVRGLAWSADGGVLAAITEPGRLFVWHGRR